MKANQGPFSGFSKLTLCMLGNLHAFDVVCWHFFSKLTLKSFLKNLSGTLSDCQTVWIQICRSWSGSKLFAEVISRRLKSLLARKELKQCSNCMWTSWIKMDISSFDNQGFRFFSRLLGKSDPWSKKWWVIFWNDGTKHIKLTTVDIWVVYFTYTLTQTLICICTLNADDTVKPFLSGHWKKKTNYHLMQVKSIAECSKGAFCNTFDLH